MPIVSVIKGEKTFREVQFGSGDVIICKAKESHDHPYDDMILLLQDGNINEIGGNAGYGGTTTDEIPMVTEPVSLRFDKPESVRVLIDDLLIIEQNLLGEDKELELRTERNMDLICAFLDHIKIESDIVVPEDVFLSFFNA